MVGVSCGAVADGVVQHREDVPKPAVLVLTSDVIGNFDAFRKNRVRQEYGDFEACFRRNGGRHLRLDAIGKGLFPGIGINGRAEKIGFGVGVVNDNYFFPPRCLTQDCYQVRA